MTENDLKETEELILTVADHILGRLGKQCGGDSHVGIAALAGCYVLPGAGLRNAVF